MLGQKNNYNKKCNCNKILVIKVTCKKLMNMERKTLTKKTKMLKGRRAEKRKSIAL